MRIGTRGSPLARAQAEEVLNRLIAAHPSLNGNIFIDIIKTTGDKFLKSSLSEIGGKGLFTKEIEEALIDKRIDLAVHSMKDVPTNLPSGLVIDCILPRVDPRDVLITTKTNNVKDLPQYSKIGTASLRRKAQLLRSRPDLEITIIRGNIGSRISKVMDGQVDATLLAYAGLHRLGIYQKQWSILSPEEMLPAVAQGAIGIERRENDEITAQVVKSLNCVESQIRISTERAFLATLEGSCRMPIGALAEFVDSKVIKLRGLIADPDGKSHHEVERTALLSEAETLGKELGFELKAQSKNNLWLN
tara:strand:+ start:7224 stop:8135 length:912 start_codon:yes stop_codon:yes gene_type:complete